MGLDWLRVELTVTNAFDSRDTREYHSRQGGSAARRWACLMLRIRDHTDDVRTLAAWATLAGVSEGSLRKYCAVAGVRAKASLDCARLLRAISSSAGSALDLSGSLDVADLRTLVRMLALGHLTQSATAPSPRDWLQRQQFVDVRTAAMQELLRMLPQ